MVSQLVSTHQGPFRGFLSRKITPRNLCRGHSNSRTALVDSVSHKPQSHKNHFGDQHQQKQNRAQLLSSASSGSAAPCACYLYLDSSSSTQPPPFVTLLRGQQVPAVPEAVGKTSWFRLEVQAHFRRKRSRRHVVRSAERGEEVIECVLVCDVHARKPQTPSVPVTLEDVVFANGGVE